MNNVFFFYQCWVVAKFHSTPFFYSVLYFLLLHFIPRACPAVSTELFSCFILQDTWTFWLSEERKMFRHILTSRLYLCMEISMDFTSSLYIILHTTARWLPRFLFLFLYWKKLNICILVLRTFIMKFYVSILNNYCQMLLRLILKK